MDIESWLVDHLRSIQSWWKLLGPDGPYYAWLAAGVLALLFWIWFSYWLIRRILGHRKFTGTWYNEAQFAILLQDLQDRERAGLIINYREAELLDRYRIGGKSKLRELTKRGGSI